MVLISYSFAAGTNGRVTREASGITFSSTGASFNELHRRSDAQPRDPYNKYEDKWDDFNNANNLDEKDGCYDKAMGMTQQVLIIDKDGTVTDVVADVDNAKSQCFRKSYLNVHFPAPPFAPFYLFLQMH